MFVGAGDSAAAWQWSAACHLPGCFLAWLLSACTDPFVGRTGGVCPAAVVCEEHCSHIGTSILVQVSSAVQLKTSKSDVKLGWKALLLDTFSKNHILMVFSTFLRFHLHVQSPPRSPGMKRPIALANAGSPSPLGAQQVCSALLRTVSLNK